MKKSGHAILDRQKHVIGIVGKEYRRCTVSTRTHLAVCRIQEGDLPNESLQAPCFSRTYPRCLAILREQK